MCVCVCVRACRENRRHCEYFVDGHINIRNRWNFIAIERIENIVLVVTAIAPYNLLPIPLISPFARVPRLPSHTNIFYLSTIAVVVAFVAFNSDPRSHILEPLQQCFDEIPKHKIAPKTTGKHWCRRGELLCMGYGERKVRSSRHTDKIANVTIGTL